jgi:RNA recognition motif-containing protein
MGNIESYMDESYLRNYFGDEGFSQIKLIRDKQTGALAGYAFLEFPTYQLAKQFLEKYLNRPMPGSSVPFRLNWAQYSNNANKAAGPEYSLFVGDISFEVTEDMIVAAFKVKFPSCTSMKIMIDPQTGHSRGYGFVKFSNQREADLAAEEMQGVYIGSKPIRISKAAYANKHNNKSPVEDQPQNIGGHHTANHTASTNVDWNQYLYKQHAYGAMNFSNPMMDPQAMAAYQQHQNSYALFTVENQCPPSSDINFFVKSHDVQTDNRNFVNGRVNTLISELSSGSWAHVQSRGLK